MTDPRERDDERYRAAREHLARLLAADVPDVRVRDAIARVPRHLFCPEEVRDRAYENRALPIGAGQTISQPLVVALTTAALDVVEGARVLEVGTGSGYQAAVLAELGAEVHTVERSKPLFERATRTLRETGYDTVHTYLGDGTRGLPELAPFDAICVTAGAPAVPGPLRAQLAPGGRLVLPVGTRERQILRRIERTPEGDFVASDLIAVVFVPLVGEHGWASTE